LIFYLAMDYDCFFSQPRRHLETILVFHSLQDRMLQVVVKQTKVN
jgi:hypothetical protein